MTKQLTINLLAVCALGACRTPEPSISDMRARLIEQAEEQRKAQATGNVSLGARATDPRARVAAVRGRSIRPGTRHVSIIDVRELLWTQPQFAAPPMDLLGSDQEPNYPEQQAGVQLMDEGTLLDAIRTSVRPGTWDEEGNSLRIVGGRLIVTHGDDED